MNPVDLQRKTCLNMWGPRGSCWSAALPKTMFTEAPNAEHDKGVTLRGPAIPGQVRLKDEG